MKFQKRVRSFAYSLALVLLVTPVARAENISTELGSQAENFANQGNFFKIVELIDAEETSWKSSPSISYFENMEQICLALMMTGSSNDQRYWLFRKAAWDALLKSAPLAKDALDIWRVDNLKERLLFAATDAIPYVVQASPDMYVTIRHDSALMLIEYARQIYAQLVPGYRYKPVAAANDPVGRKRLRQNEIDNAIQDEMRMASHRLASRRYVYDLTMAYSHPPRDDWELKQVLDALNIQGANRETIIRVVTGGRDFSAEVQSSRFAPDAATAR